MDTNTIINLIEKLKDKNSAVRNEAVTNLVTLNQGESIPLLINLLGDKNKKVSDLAGYILNKLGATGQIELIYSLHQQNAQVRAAAVKAIAYALVTSTSKLSDSLPEQALIVALSDENSAVRAQAAAAFAGVKYLPAVEPLIKLLADENSQVSFQAVRALGKQADPLALKPLLKKLSVKTPLRTAIIPALTHMDGKQVIDFVIEIVLDKSDDLRVRQQAAMALGNIKDSKAVTPLLLVLQDSTDPLRDYAARALAALKERKAVVPLINLLKDTNKQVRRDAAFALSKINAPEALDALIEALRDEFVGVRYFAVIALSKLGNHKALPELEWIEKHDNASTVEEIDSGTMQEAAAFAILKIKQQISL